MRKLRLVFYLSLMSCWIAAQVNPFMMPAIDFPANTQQLLDARNNNTSLTLGGVINNQWNTPTWQSNYKVNDVKTRLTLQIANERNTLAQDWDITVPILLTVYDEGGNVSHTSTQNLSVFYKHAVGTQYKEVDLKEINGGYKFTAEILVPQITSTTNNLLSQIFAIVDITASILHERVNDFDPNYHHTWGQIDIDRTNVLTKGVVVICWDEIPGATSYDLEWTYAESYDSPPGLIGMTGTTVSFNENSSRVSLSDLCYTMPIVYEKGLLLYRVRGKGYDKDNPNQLLTGKWSCSNPYNNCTTYDNISPFEWYSSVGISTSHEGDNKNWQAVTSYAEEGKRKDVVTYMDGTLRSRQTTTLINSDQNALVAETIYDHQGRPAIQTLPAPVWKDMQLKFRQNFNQNTAFKPYSKLDFDVNPATCGQDNVPAMNEAQGASLYYSRSLYQVFNTGDIADKPHLAYIPEAFGYPFVQTEYTADNTGRIARQGGAGREFQLGSGHETKYFYGVPAQEELDILFGTNVGIANHYKKNLVVDPNGQSSVSYMDAKGNTIATALAGEAPKNDDGTVKLEQLDSYNPRRINVDLLAFNMKSVEDKSISASYTLLVENKGSYILNYEVLAAKFMDDCMPNNTCYDCVYDLNITVTEDACGKTIFSSGPIKINHNNIDYACEAAANYNSGNIELQDLEKGSYKIIKKLTVNEAAANQYVEHYINDAYNECTNVLEEMLLEELAKVDTTDCSIGCDDVDPVTEADWSEMLCDTMPSSPCEVAEMLMKSDFMPGGQYAKFGDDYAISTDPLSIFNPNNLLKNRNSNLPVTWELTVYPSTDAIELNGSMVYPGNLSIKDYIQNYDEKWADHFLEYHPEYCYLERCRVIEPSYDYDTKLQEEDSYANAKSNGWIDISNNGNQIYNLDPYKTQSLAQSGSLSNLLNKVQNFGSDNSGVSILDFAIYSVMCETNDYSAYSENPALLDNLQPGSINMTNCLATINSIYGSLANLPIDTLDLIWQNYRSFYLSIKNNIEYVERTRLAKDVGCYNECIGQQQFNPLINQFWNPPIYGGFFDDDQICNINTYLLYKNKDKRFPGVYDILPNMDIDYYNPNTKITDVWQNAMTNLDTEISLSECDDCPDINLIKDLLKQSWRVGADLNEVLSKYGNPQVDFDRAHILGTGKYNSYTINDDCIYYTYQETSTRIASIDTIFALNQDYVFPFILGSEPRYNFSFVATFVNGARDTLVGFSSCPVFCVEKTAGPSCRTLPEAHDFQSLLNNIHYSKHTVTGNTTTWNPSIQTAALGDSLKSVIGLDTVTRLRYPLNIRLENEKLIITFYNGCTATLDMSTVDADFIHINSQGFVNLYGYTNIQPDFSQVNAQGYTDHFTLRLRNKDGKEAIIKGYTNGCFHIGKCCVDQPLQSPRPNPTKPSEGKPTPNPKPGIKPNNQLKPLKPSKKERNPMVDKPVLAVNPKPTPKVAIDPYCIKCDELKINGGIFDTIVFSRACENIFCRDSFPVIYYDEPLNKECIDQLFATAEANAYNRYKIYIDSVRRDVMGRYIAQCMTAKETFTGDFAYTQHHFTLYYYDQSNNLVQTVPPNGVQLLDANEMAQMKTYRADTTNTVAAPTVNAIDPRWASEYSYNSLNQLTSQKIPDQGAMAASGFQKLPTRFWYDDLGRLVASQNPEQATKKEYAYTLYDGLGRLRETGSVMVGSDPDGGQQRPIITGTYSNGAIIGAEPSWTNFMAGIRTQITQTIYDEPYYLTNSPSGFPNLSMENLRSRVSAAIVYETKADMDTRKPEYATHYSYDIHGNVKALIQQPKGLQAKTIEYSYDLISGNVNYVWYQRDKKDQFTHRYTYDADNRLTLVRTSRDGLLWDEDAHYIYYPHGPLARVELGEEEVQGLDYAYTLQGWIKGMNSASLQQKLDIGRDGVQGHKHENFARDEVGFTLNYHQQDYTPISRQPAQTIFTSDWNTNTITPELYNGNIRSMVTAIRKFMPDGKPAAYSYRYDQLNRIKSMNYHNDFNPTSNRWNSFATNNSYKTNYSYDANGNILHLNRDGVTSVGTALPMDAFSYAYTPGTNRLRHVTDPIPAGNYTNDIDNQNPDNYTYDRIGNLAKDEAEGITNIAWNLSGKVSEITKADGKKQIFRYDALGNRISKSYRDTTTYYIRDASGNIMANYERRGQPMGQLTLNTEVRWTSATIYGSSRIGEYYAEMDMTVSSISVGSTSTTISGGYQGDATTATGSSSQTQSIYTSTLLRGKIQYELTNHLGNVLATIADRKRLERTQQGLSGFVADVVTASDYYPEGVIMDNRNFKAFDYPFKHQGQITDNKVSGEGNAYFYKYRMNDVRLNRFFSVDPEFKLYPFESNYSFVMNNLLNCVDLNGDLVLFINGMHTGDGGNPKYWVSEDGTIEMDKEIMHRIGDWKSAYFDGAMGGSSQTLGYALAGGRISGFIGSLVSVFGFSNVNKNQRIASGKNMGKEMAPFIFGSLAEGESIKLITHSMGAAYSRGFIRSLRKYAREHSLEFNLELVADFNAYQGSALTSINVTDLSNEGINNSLFVSGGNDGLANGLWGRATSGTGSSDISGSKEISPKSNKQGHTIFDSFTKFIMSNIPFLGTTDENYLNPFPLKTKQEADVHVPIFIESKIDD